MISANFKGVTKFRVPLEKKMHEKRGKISANFKKVAKFRFIFGIWLICGLKLTIRNWNIGVVQKNVF